MFSLKSELKQKRWDTSFFRIMFIVVMSLEMLAFIDLFMGALKCFIVMWGLFIFINNFYNTRRFLKVDHKYLIFMFLLSMCITAVVNFSVWFLPNIVLVYINASYFFMFYGMHTETPHKKVEEEMVFLLKFFVWFGLICGFLSLCFVFLKNETSVLGYYIGIYKNRLIGIYTNSNILAFSMIECIVAADILSTDYIKNKYKDKYLNNLVLVLAVIVSCICLFLSDSNASFLFLIIYSTIRVFCNLFFRRESSYLIKFIKSVVVTLSFCIVVMSVSFALRDICQKYISEVITGVYKQEQMMEYNFENFKGDIMEELPEKQSEPEKSEKAEKNYNVSDFTIGRHESYDVSSGRILLFKQGIKIFKHSPIFGVGRASLISYGKKYIEGGLINLDLHNGYLTILVCYGIVGLAIFGLFSFVVAVDVCKHLFGCFNKPYYGVFVRIFSALVAYCGYCMFEKAILFDVTFMVGFFWSMLGYAVSYVHNFEKPAEK